MCNAVLGCLTLGSPDLFFEACVYIFLRWLTARLSRPSLFIPAPRWMNVTNYWQAEGASMYDVRTEVGRWLRKSTYLQTNSTRNMWTEGVKGVKSILRILYMEVPIHLFTCFMLVEGRLGVNVVARLWPEAEARFCWDRWGKVFLAKVSFYMIPSQFWWLSGATTSELFGFDDACLSFFPSYSNIRIIVHSFSEKMVALALR